MYRPGGLRTLDISREQAVAISHRNTWREFSFLGLTAPNSPCDLIGFCNPRLGLASTWWKSCKENSDAAGNAGDSVGASLPFESVLMSQHGADVLDAAWGAMLQTSHKKRDL